MRRAVWTADGLEVVEGDPGPLTPGWVRLQRLMMKEVALLGSFCYGGGDREPEFATDARLTGRWREELTSLTTHQFALDDVAAAFAAVGDKASGAIKVTLLPGSA